MPFGDQYWAYKSKWDEWNNWSSSAQQTITFNYPTYSDSTNPLPSPAPKIEMPEGPLDWLRRRVVEITDLAYAA